MTLAVPGSAARNDSLWRWWTVIVLLFLTTCSITDRQVMSMLVQPIKAEFGVDDFQMGLLLGPAFGIFYALCALPTGILGDYLPRRLLIFGAAILWGAATIACGLAGSYSYLFTARASLGLGESAILPSAHAMLSGLFGQRQLALPISVMNLCAPLGAAIGLVMAGYVMSFVGHHGEASLGALGHIRAWKLVFFAAGAPAILFAFLMLTTRESAGQTAINRKAAGSISVWRFIRARPRIFAALYLGVGMNVVMVNGFSSWIPTFLERTYGMSPLAIGSSFGLVNILCLTTGSLFAGWAVDRLYQRHMRDAHLRYLLFAVAISLPFTVVAFFMPSSWLFLILISVYFFLGYPCMGAAAAAVQIFAPPAIRGRLAALLMLSVTLCGVLLGPTSVGLMTEFVFRDPKKIGSALAIVSVAASFASIALLWQGLRPMREAPETDLLNGERLEVAP